MLGLGRIGKVMGPIARAVVIGSAFGFIVSIAPVLAAVFVGGGAEGFGFGGVRAVKGLLAGS